MSQKDKVEFVMRHIITLYQKDENLSSQNPLKYPYNLNAYELRVIDDDIEYYTPFYEIGALDLNDYIGEYECLAFVSNKNYKPLPMISTSIIIEVLNFI